MTYLKTEREVTITKHEKQFWPVICLTSWDLRPNHVLIAANQCDEFHTTVLTYLKPHLGIWVYVYNQMWGSTCCSSIKGDSEQV